MIYEQNLRMKANTLAQNKIKEVVRKQKRLLREKAIRELKSV